MAGLEIKGIRKRFADVTALDNITLSIKKGELFFLLGPSGCGKTTLLRILAGFCLPDRGSVTYGGGNLLLTPVEKRNIGMVFQSYSLWPHMSVFDNVAYGLKMRKVNPAQIEKKVVAALDMVDMNGLGDRKPAQLSGGQQQRVALARALVYEPELLLLDEPLSNLDARLRKEMRHEIAAIHRRLGITMIYVTHDQEEAATMADRIALLRAGRIVQVGTPEQMYYSPGDRFTAEFFGSANIIEGRVTAVMRDAARIAVGDMTLLVKKGSGGTLPAEGAAVFLAIRPADLVFAGGDEAENTFSGTITSRSFNGAVETYLIQIGPYLLSLMTLFSARGSFAAAGDTIRVTVSPNAISLIHKGESS